MGLAPTEEPDLFTAHYYNLYYLPNHDDELREPIRQARPASVIA